MKHNQIGTPGVFTERQQALLDHYGTRAESTFVELRDRLKQLTLRYGLMDTLDKDHFYPSIEAAFDEIRSEESGA